MSVNEQEAKEDKTDAEDRIKDKSLKKKLRKKGREVLLVGPKMFRRFFFISFRRLHQICQDCKVNHLKGTCEEPITTEYCKMAKKMKFNCINLKHMGAKNLIWMKMIWKNMNKSASFDDFLHVVLRNEAKRFSYVLKLFGAKATNIFEGQVAAIAELFDTLWKSGKCFAILHDALVAQFLDVYLRSGTYEN